MPDPRIKTVILWTNGIVMVADQDDQQMPEYQGPVNEVLRKIHAAYKGVWEVHDWNTEVVPFMDKEGAIDAIGHATRDRLHGL